MGDSIGSSRFCSFECFVKSWRCKSLMIGIVHLYMIYIYIYTRGDPGSPMEKRWGWVGWGGVGHGTRSVMLRCCYVHGRGGVGWGMVASCSCYVAATCCYVHGRGGVGWGMVASCYVAATFMGGVGWGGAW